MKILKEPIQLKYKNNIRIETENGDIIRINKRDRTYLITGFDRNLNMIKPRNYQSFNGVKDYMLRTYNIELEK